VMVSDASGKPVSYRETTPDEWITEAKVREGEKNPEQIDHLVNLWKGLLQANQSKSMAELIGKVNMLYQNTTGEAPTPLDRWLKGESRQRVLAGGGGQNERAHSQADSIQRRASRMGDRSVLSDHFKKAQLCAEEAQLVENGVAFAA
jgi:hypothetical protein